jgi:hypothetical protein
MTGRIYSTSHVLRNWLDTESCEHFSDFVWVQESSDRARIREEVRLTRIRQEEESK